jgi:hypothetical protein
MSKEGQFSVHLISETTKDILIYLNFGALEALWQPSGL